MIYRVTFQRVVDVEAPDEERAEEMAMDFVEKESNNFEDGVSYLECKVKPVKLNLINSEVDAERD